MAANAAIALNRFGLGARLDEAPPTDPAKWLTAQFDRFEVKPAGFAALPDPARILTEYYEDRRDAKAAAPAGAAQRRPGSLMQRPAMAEPMMTGPDMAEPAMAEAPRADKDTDPVRAALRAARREGRGDIQGVYRQAVNARVASALITPAPFVERLVHFWANHFAISAEKQPVTAYAGAFEAEAIRPHVLGKFADMMLAVERHPAMMVFLDQATSVGPNSPLAQRVAQRRPDAKRGLNENLAREIMELHTLGVRSGYTQADVTELARAMTGWSIGGFQGNGPLQQGAPGKFVFRAAVHEPGERTILGKSYRQEGETQARAAFLDFAASPATAKHVATKLARHFAGDTPPPAMVARLADAFTRSGGDLPTVYAALVASPEAWAPQPVKFKSPWEWTVSSLRGLGRTSVDKMQFAPLIAQLGQPVWKPGSPAGWDDTVATWAAPDALVRRVEVAQRFAAVAGDRIDARKIGPQLMPVGFDPAARTEIERAESPTSALALLLVSPDFLRR